MSSIVLLWNRWNTVALWKMTSMSMKLNGRDTIEDLFHHHPKDNSLALYGNRRSATKLRRRTRTTRTIHSYWQYLVTTYCELVIHDMFFWDTVIEGMIMKDKVEDKITEYEVILCYWFRCQHLSASQDAPRTYPCALGRPVEALNTTACFAKLNLFLGCARAEI